MLTNLVLPQSKVNGLQFVVGCMSLKLPKKTTRYVCSRLFKVIELALIERAYIRLPISD